MNWNLIDKLINREAALYDCFDRETTYSEDLNIYYTFDPSDTDCLDHLIYIHATYTIDN